jgi:superfamily I DNA/RNA helicase
METALRQAGVRYHLIGGQSFFDRREIRDFVAYLKTFINPHDDISLLRIANVPARGLTDVTMERLLAASHERKCSVYAAMKNPAVTTTFQARTRESIEAFVAFIEKTRAFFIQNALHREPRLVQDWADSFLRETGYLEDLRRLEKTVDAADSRVRNVLEMAAELDGDDPSLAPQDRLHHYLEDLSLDSDRSEQKEIEGDAVTLITMHSCKGLEYPHVYIVGLERGLLPHARALQDGTLDEERRLFYVALTRAMKTLSLSHCNTRKKYGKLTPCHPSGFLKELPSELLEDGDATAKAPVKPAAGKSMFDAMRALCD